MKDPKIVMVYPDIEFGKDGLRAAEKYLQRFNLRLAGKAVLALSAIDATSQVLTLKRSNPDYVILHELVHIQHRDHSNKFWEALDELTGGNSKNLRKELRGQRIMLVNPED